MATDREGKVTAGYVPIEHPSNKAAIEREVFMVFLRAVSRGAAQPVPMFAQNAENDLDFTIYLPGGKVKIDLMEMVFNEGPGSPYASDEQVVFSKPFAQQVFDKIMAKSRAYETRPPGPKQLLLYTTHWRFNPSDVVLALIAYGLAHTRHIFTDVVYLHRFSQSEGHVRFLWPDGHLRSDFDPAEYDDHSVINLPAHGLEFMTSDTDEEVANGDD